MTPSNATLVALAVLWSVTPGLLSGQDHAQDPAWVAATWALEAASLAGLGSRLVVDSARGAAVVEATQGRSLSASERQRRRAFAASLGARSGALSTHFECPTEPVQRRSGATALLHHGCRLTDGVEAVIQVDPPRAREDGYDVTVTTWVFRLHPLGDGWILGSTSRDMRLHRAPSGELTVSVVRTTIGHW